MKRKTDNKTFRSLWQGLAGLCLSVSFFVLPVTGFAEQAVPKANETVQAETDTTARAEQTKTDAAQQSAEDSPAKYVMPQEQVYLDPSQVEAAKKQLEADAVYNAQPQAKNVEVITGDRVIADVKVVEQDNKGNVPATNTISETKKAEDNNNLTVKPEKAETEKPVPAVTKEVKETKTETIQPQDAVKEKPEIPKAAETKNLESKPEVKHKPFHLHRFGVAKEFTTHHGTVGEVLREMKINMEGRTVYPPPETKITDGMVIHVLARKSFLSREEVEVPFGTQVINDPEMAFGTKKVEKEGVKGKDLVTYENITRPGREQKIELDRRRVVQPVNEIVRQGVAQSILTPDGYVKYKKVIYGEATAYTWGGGATGYTSVGLWPKRGIVAVDPRVIPYYTKLYIPGYGMALAADTGGAIIGNRIDLFMDSLHECFQWGRRDVEIYILE